MSDQKAQRAFNGELTGTVGTTKVVKFSGDATADDLGYADPQVALATDPVGDHVAGVCEVAGENGDKRRILLDGIVEMEAGAAFDRSAGEVWATFDANGDPIPWVPGSGKQCIGAVLFPQGVDYADGDPIQILLGVTPADMAVSGTATVVLGNGSIAVVLPAAVDGKPAVACIMQGADDATATYVKRVEWDGSGQLTINLNANTTAAVTVAYFVHA